MRSAHWKAVCKAEADQLGVRPEIHAEDFIYQFIRTTPYFRDDEDGGIRYYFQDGRQSARNLRNLLADVCSCDGSRRIRLLEFSAGYGCVTRHLTNEIPYLDVTACDIHPQAVQFLRETLGTDAVLSAHRPEGLALDPPFDVVFALSFFSHMPKCTFDRWIRRLASFVKSGGFFIFTTHGVESKKLLGIGPYDGEGFSFSPYSERKDLDTSEYGVTATLPEYVFLRLFREADCRPVFFREGYWWKHQDVYIVRRDDAGMQSEAVHLSEKSGWSAQTADLLAEKDRHIQKLSAELAGIRDSRVWPVLQWIRRMRERLAPPGSTREQFVSSVLGPSPAERRARFEREHRFAHAGERRQVEKTVRDLAAGLDDEQYLMLILSSIENPFIDGIRMPGFPTDEVQRMFVGSAKETALREGFTFYRCVKRYCRSLGAPIGGRTRILDFGCGWGRMARFFFKDVDCENILGVDVAPDMIAFCRAEMTCGQYRQIDPLPPLSFLEDRSLDVVFAYSVFSHLAESTARAWVAEFSRVLRPGGVFLATTQRRSFLDVCASFHGKTEFVHLWHRSLSQSFIPIEKAKEEYDSGKFLFSDGGGVYGDNPHYGEALIPKSYIQREYSRYLLLRDFLDDPARLPQALFVMQKPD